jgi:hypothetical protein
MTHFHAIPESGDGIVILTNSQRSWPFMAFVLTDWARWSGAGRVDFGRIVWGSRAVRAAVVILVLASLAQVYRLGRDALRGRRRLSPFSTARRGVRGFEAAVGAAIIGGLGWAVSQPYIFLSWIFPATTPLAGWALLLGALVLLAGAALPRRQQG